MACCIFNAHKAFYLPSLNSFPSKERLIVHSEVSVFYDFSSLEQTHSFLFHSLAMLMLDFQLTLIILKSTGCLC